MPRTLSFEEYRVRTTQREQPIGRLRRAFLEFHRENPWVYRRLVELCFELKGAGFNRYSMRTLISVLRFEFDLKTSGEEVVLADGEPRRVKLNNNHSPYYARMLVDQYPQFKTFFEFRRAEGDKAAADEIEF